MHADGGRGERVVGREEESSPVLTIFVGCFRRAGKDVVPSALEGEGFNYNGLERGGRQGDELEDIRFRGMGYDVGRWILLDCLVFTGELREVSELFVERRKDRVRESYSFVRSTGGHCRVGIYFENEILL